MPPLTPTDRPALEPAPLIDALHVHGVRWVLCGSHVLTLHGAALKANDLDVVPDLTSENLSRVAACLAALNARRAHLNGWGGARGTMAACLSWRPEPPTASNLDWLYVTPHGMLDIVIENADPFDALMQGASRHTSGSTPYFACAPWRVLQALEKRTRKKDKARMAIYAAMRARFPKPLD